MMKLRRLAYFLSLLMTLALVGCDDDGSSSSSGEKQPDVTPDNPVTPDDPVTPSADTVTEESCDSNYVESCENEVAHLCDNGKVTLRDCQKLKTTNNPVTCHVSEDNFADCVIACDADEFSAYTSCDGKYVVYHSCDTTTDGGTYDYGYMNEPCPVACDGGRCVETLEPKVGDKCESSLCYGNAVYACQNGVYTKTPCGESATCAQQFGDPTPQCVTSCASTSEDIYQCTQVNGKPAIDNRVCRLATNSHFYLFQETATCETSCSEGVCDVAIPAAGDACNVDEMDDLCIHNALYYCHSEKNQVVVEKCGSGDVANKPLCRYLHQSYADCVSPCEEGAESLLSCGGSSSKKNQYTSNEICEEAQDGQFYYFLEQEMCESGLCSKGVCQ